MGIDAVIFDLDGTLWDSTATVADSWNMSMDRLCPGAQPFTAAHIAEIMGRTDIEIERMLFSPYGERAHELCRSCMTEEPPYIAVHGGKIYEGVEKMLRTLSGRFPLFIVSNCQSGYVEAFLSYSGFGPYFKDYEYQGRRGLSKRENIRLIMDRHGLENCVYVGDTQHDEESALAAGCRFVHAAYGFGSAAAPAASAESPSALLDIIDSL